LQSDIFERRVAREAFPFRHPEIVAFTTREVRPGEEHEVDYYFKPFLKRDLRSLRSLTLGKTTDGHYATWVEEYNFRYSEALWYENLLERQVPVVIMGRFRTPLLLQDYAFPSSRILSFIPYRTLNAQLQRRSLQNSAHARDGQFRQSEIDELMTDMLIAHELPRINARNVEIDTSEKNWLKQVLQALAQPQHP
jgi:hypothetical protein